MGTGRRHEFVPSKGKTAGPLASRGDTKKPRRTKRPDGAEGFALYRFAGRRALPSAIDYPPFTPGISMAFTMSFI
jgi:hypothetical protein